MFSQTSVCNSEDIDSLVWPIIAKHEQNFTHLDANHTVLLSDMQNMNRNPSSVTGNQEQMFLLMVTCSLKCNSLFYHRDTQCSLWCLLPFRKRKSITPMKSSISWGRNPQCFSNVLCSWTFWTAPKFFFF